MSARRTVTPPGGRRGDAATSSRDETLRLLHKTRRSASRLQGLAATFASVAAAQDLSAALRALLGGAVDLLDGTRGVVALWDPETGRRHHQVSLLPDGTFRETRNRPPPAERSFQWRLWQGENSILIEDYLQLDPAAYPLYDQMIQEGNRSAVNVPIDLSGPTPRRLGALCVNSSQRRRFTEDDRALAAALASEAAAAVERARMHESERAARAAAESAEQRLRALNTQLEQRVAERTAQLEATNKELEAFSYTVAHDLRAPLRAMDGFSRILLEEHTGQLPPEGQRYLQLVRANAQHMAQLIDDLLTFSRVSRQVPSRQPVVPAALARQVLAELDDGRKQRQVEVAIGELAPAVADPLLLQQVFANLLANALKFTRRRERALIEVGSCTDGGDTVYYVRDNGVGFDMRYADKLFGVFQRLHRVEDYEGTGVGLAIVQRIVHRHGGRIWAEAAVDEGATFYFTLGRKSADG